MLFFVEYESAAAPSLRLRNSDREFWDFVALGWVAVDGDDCRADFLESENGDGTSLYTVIVTLPAGGPFIQEAVLPSGEVVAYDYTTAESGTAPTVEEIRAELDDNSTKLARLDATVSSRSTYAGGAVASVTGAVGSVTTPVTVGTNNDKTGYGLSATAILAIWNQGTAAVGVVVNTMGAKLRDLILGSDSKVMISADAQDLSATLKVDAKIVEDKTGYALTGPYDPAKSAASQASLDAIPTAPLLAADSRLDYLNAPVSAIPTDPLRAGDFIAPDNAGIAAVYAVIVDAAHGLARLDVELDAIAAALPDLATNADAQTLLERLTDARATLLDNLQYLTGAVGLTTEQDEALTGARDEARLARQMQTNKAIIANDGLSVTIYADDAVTPLWTFSIPSNRERVPA